MIWQPRDPGVDRITARSGKACYGMGLGVMLLDESYPGFPGDVRNASSSIGRIQVSRASVAHVILEVCFSRPAKASALAPEVSLCCLWLLPVPLKTRAPRAGQLWLLPTVSPRQQTTRSKSIKKRRRKLRPMRQRQWKREQPLRETNARSTRDFLVTRPMTVQGYLNAGAVRTSLMRVVVCAHYVRRTITATREKSV